MTIVLRLGKDLFLFRVGRKIFWSATLSTASHRSDFVSLSTPHRGPRVIIGTAFFIFALGGQ